MTYSITDEITPTLNHEEYRTRLRITIQEVAAEMSTASEGTAFDPEKELEAEITEFLTAVDDLYLTHPISVIEHSEASLSHRGASHLGDVSTTEDFAQEHARDLYEQEIGSALKRVLEGETVARVRKATADESVGPFVTIGSFNESENGREQVRVSAETAKLAKEELRSHVDYADGEMETSGAEEAIEDLERSLQEPAPRTIVERQKNIEKIIVPGVPREALSVDFAPNQPRAVIHTDDNTVLEPVVRLPSGDDDSSSGGTEPASNSRGGN